MTTEVANIQTGEIIPVTNFPVAVNRLEISEVQQAVSYVDELRNSVMQNGVDYGMIPETNKLCLYKAGAEKLAFAFQLVGTFSVVDKTEDFFCEWDYVSYGKRKTALGLYSYTVRCEVRSKNTNNIVGECLGSCNSTERGREVAPSNTILKMAEKRAYVGAILNATFSSDRFTQDVEDFRNFTDEGNDRDRRQAKKQGKKQGKEENGKQAPPPMSIYERAKAGEQSLRLNKIVEEADIVDARLAYLRDSSGNKSEKQLEIAQASEESVHQYFEKFVAPTFREWNAKQENATPSTNGAQPTLADPPVQAESVKSTTVKNIERLEVELFSEDPNWTQEHRDKLRRQSAGNDNLAKASEVGLKSYLNKLEKMEADRAYASGK